MRTLLAGLALCLVLLGIEGARPRPGAAWVSAVPWTALGLFWFCLQAKEWQGIAAGWITGWAWELAGGGPPGHLAVTTGLAATAAAVARGWIRHDAWVPAALFAVSFTGGLLALQGAWFWAAGPASAGDVLVLWGKGTALAALAGAPLVWLLQKGRRLFLPDDHAEAFAR